MNAVVAIGKSEFLTLTVIKKKSDTFCLPQDKNTVLPIFCQPTLEPLFNWNQGFQDSTTVENNGETMEVLYTIRLVNSPSNSVQTFESYLGYLCGF